MRIPNLFRDQDRSYVARTCLAFALVAAVSSSTCRADDSVRIGSTFQRDRVDRSIDRAVNFLMRFQDDDGRWAGAINDSYNHLTVMTSLAMLAMTSVGHQPTDPTPQGRAVRNALEFVLRADNQDRNGYFGRDGSRMYGHGITTLMLAEMLGMGVDDEQDRIIRDRLSKAIKLILWSQQIEKGWHSRGGWRYTPDANDSDLSVTVWQVMALRSAKNAGLKVPSEAIDDAVAYIRRCYNDNYGAFGYQPGSHMTYSTTSAGLLSMQVCGKYDSDEVKGSADLLMQVDLDYSKSWFFYGTYYYAQGMYQRGGDFAKAARQRVAEVLLDHQADDGSWGAHGNGSERNVGRGYATSMAILSLSVKYHYLSIYQR